MCSLGSLVTGLRATLDSCQVGEAQEEEGEEEVLPRLVVNTKLESMMTEYRTVLQPARAQDWSPPLDDTATAMLTALSLAVFTNSLGLDPSEEVNYQCRQTDVIENNYGTVQELRSTFYHTKSINIDFSLGLVFEFVFGLVEFVCGQDGT